LEAAVVRGGGVLGGFEQAEGLIWTDAAAAVALKERLPSSPARWVQLPFAGTESFFSAGAVDPNRTWTCAKGIYGPATAEHALTLLLAAARRLHLFVRAKTWLHEERSGVGQLRGAHVFLVGTGGIGRALAAMLQPLGARLTAINRSGSPLEAAERTVASEELPRLLPEADFVVLAAALTPQTRGLFGAELFARMKQSAWIINVARGGLVDHAALLEALTAHRIAGAALDVTEPEPLPDGHPLWSHPRVIITPHVANTWEMALPHLAAMVERNVRHFARGEPLEGLVDVGLGY
jgi:D-3-phosphoglycerate dehydrogenase